MRGEADGALYDIDVAEHQAVPPALTCIDTGTHHVLHMMLPTRKVRSSVKAPDRITCEREKLPIPSQDEELESRRQACV